MNRIYPLNALLSGSSAFVYRVTIGGALGMRLRDLGFTRGTKIKALFSGDGIRAYGLCGTVIALRDKDAAGVEVADE